MLFRQNKQEALAQKRFPNSWCETETGQLHRHRPMPHADMILQSIESPSSPEHMVECLRHWIRNLQNCGLGSN